MALRGPRSPTPHAATHWEPSALGMPVSTRGSPQELRGTRRLTHHRAHVQCSVPGGGEGHGNTRDRFVTRHKQDSGCLGPKGAGTWGRWCRPRPEPPVGGGAAVTARGVCGACAQTGRAERAASPLMSALQAGTGDGSRGPGALFLVQAVFSDHGCFPRVRAAARAPGVRVPP